MFEQTVVEAFPTRRLLDFAMSTTQRDQFYAVMLEEERRNTYTGHVLCPDISSCTFRPVRRGSDMRGSQGSILLDTTIAVLQNLPERLECTVC